MKKAILALTALAMLGLTACDNAASKIRNAEDSEPATSAQASNDAMNNNLQQNQQNQAAQEINVDPENAPEFGFEKESHDFGVIKEGTLAKTDFTFTNTGKTPLIITNASGSCGCTVPSWPREPIAPGETGTIHVEFDSQGKPGNQTKQVTLTANTVPNKKILNISAQVTPKPGQETPNPQAGEAGNAQG